MCNDKYRTAEQVLAHKGQPTIEKRFEQLNTVHEFAPVFPENPGRIAAFFTMYFFALLAQALIERELRRAMQRQRLKALPIYPQVRRCARPTTEQILQLFAHAQRHTLTDAGSWFRPSRPTSRRGSSKSLNCRAFRSVPSAADGGLEIRPNYSRHVQKMRLGGAQSDLIRCVALLNSDENACSQRAARPIRQCRRGRVL